jgi:hypothetical protein
MKTLRFIFFIIFLGLILPADGQDNTVVLQRTPEQEAVKQTEKLQQELGLDQEQTKRVYEINLKYARERQVSNTRSAAMERMKNKNADIERVLNDDQNYRLQSKRYDRNSFESPSLIRKSPYNASGTNSTMRAPSSENNLRNNYRTATPQNERTAPQNQTLRRSTTAPTYTPRAIQPSSRPQQNNNQGSRQSVKPASPDNSSSRQQSTPSSTPRRTETPANTNRR